MIRALELFSGIGAFATACRKHSQLHLVAAYDQSAEANATYELNFGISPRSKNLDSILASQLDAAELWWMSPPCQPYSVRGSGKDLDDPRARSLLNLVGLMRIHQPQFVIVENVLGFADSQAEELLLQTLAQIGLKSHIFDLCPTMFGIPMRRPRRFVAAKRNGNFDDSPPRPLFRHPLKEYLQEPAEPALKLPDQEFKKYGRSLDILEGNENDYAICFTRGYGRSMKAAGSYIRLADGGARHFAPREILNLLGFPENFSFPDEMSLSMRWKLAGNSVSIHCLEHVLLSTLGR